MFILFGLTATVDESVTVVELFIIILTVLFSVLPVPDADNIVMLAPTIVLAKAFFRCLLCAVVVIALSNPAPQ